MFFRGGLLIEPWKPFHYYTNDPKIQSVVLFEDVVYTCNLAHQSGETFAENAVNFTSAGSGGGGTGNSLYFENVSLAPRFTDTGIATVDTVVGCTTSYDTQIIIQEPLPADYSEFDGLGYGFSASITSIRPITALNGAGKFLYFQWPESPLVDTDGRFVIAIHSSNVTFEQFVAGVFNNQTRYPGSMYVVEHQNNVRTTAYTQTISRFGSISNYSSLSVADNTFPAVGTTVRFYVYDENTIVFTDAFDQNVFGMAMAPIPPTHPTGFLLGEPLTISFGYSTNTATTAMSLFNIYTENGVVYPFHTANFSPFVLATEAVDGSILHTSSDGPFGNQTVKANDYLIVTENGTQCVVIRNHNAILSISDTVNLIQSVIANELAFEGSIQNALSNALLPPITIASYSNPADGDTVYMTGTETELDVTINDSVPRVSLILNTVGNNAFTGSRSIKITVITNTTIDDLHIMHTGRTKSFTSVACEANSENVFIFQRRGSYVELTSKFVL